MAISQDDVEATVTWKHYHERNDRRETQKRKPRSRWIDQIKTMTGNPFLFVIPLLKTVISGVSHPKFQSVAISLEIVGVNKRPTPEHRIFRPHFTIQTETI